MWALVIIGSLLQADFKSVPVEHFSKLPEPSNINLNFTMGNSQEVPTQNNANATTKKIHVEHKMEPMPQESTFTKIKNSFIVGAAGALGSAAMHKVIENSGTIIEFFRKILIKG